MKLWELLVICIFGYAWMFMAIRTLFIWVMKQFGYTDLSTEATIAGILCILGGLFIIGFLLYKGIILVANKVIAPRDHRYAKLRPIILWFYLGVFAAVLFSIWRQNGI